ncbi:peptidoglycan-binding domain-containing protein [Streptomyces mayteni]
MRRLLSTITAAAALVTGLGLTSIATAGPAGAAGWCDGSKGIPLAGRYIRVPYNVASNSTNCTLAQGASGSAVTALQDALRRCNHQDQLAVDASFGNLTRQALEDAQERRGTTPDGVYGPNTRDALAWPLYLDGSFLICRDYPS